MVSVTGVGRDFGGANLFSQWVGFAILSGYALASLLIGGILLVRRDA